MAKFCFSDANIHIFPSHSLVQEINLPADPRDRMYTETNGLTYRDAVSTQCTLSIYQAPLWALEDGIPALNFQQLVKSLRVGFADRHLGTGFPSPGQRPLPCSPGRMEELTLVLYCV